MTELRRFIFLTLVLVFKKIESDDKTKYDNFYSNSKVEMIINDSDIDDVFESVDTAKELDNSRFKIMMIINALMEYSQIPKSTKNYKSW